MLQCLNDEIFIDMNERCNEAMLQWK